MKKNEFKDYINNLTDEYIKRCDCSTEDDENYLREIKEQIVNAASILCDQENCDANQLIVIYKIISSQSVKYTSLSLLLKCCSYIIHNGYDIQKAVRNIKNGKKGVYDIPYCEIEMFSDIVSLRKKVGDDNRSYPVGSDAIYNEKKRLERLWTDMHFEDDVRKRYEEENWLEREMVIDGERYIFSIPKTIREIKDEAATLKNCIAIRLKDYLDKKLVYVFMRKANTPHKPYADIIINKPTDEVLWAITEYHANVKDTDKKAVDTFMNTMRREKWQRKLNIV